VKNEEDHIPKSLLVINDIIIVCGCIVFIVGLFFFVKHMIELDDKYSSNATALIHKNINNEVISCEILNGTYKTIYENKILRDEFSILKYDKEGQFIGWFNLKGEKSN